MHFVGFVAIEVVTTATVTIRCQLQALQVEKDVCKFPYCSLTTLVTFDHQYFSSIPVEDYVQCMSLVLEDVVQYCYRYNVQQMLLQASDD